MGAPLPGASGQDALDFFASQLCRRYLLRRELRQPLLLLRGRRRLDTIVNRFAELARKLAVDFAGIAAHPRGDLRRQQSRDDAVFVCRPDAAIETDERRAGTLLPAKAERAVEQAIDKPFEADRHLVELAAELRRDAIDLDIRTATFVDSSCETAPPARQAGRRACGHGSPPPSRRHVRRHVLVKPVTLIRPGLRLTQQHPRVLRAVREARFG